ncbi:hypothetical protein ACQJBY_014472 [Aegilops geniculata]
MPLFVFLLDEETSFVRCQDGDDWMNHRMVCYIERDVFVSIEESKIIERFQGYRTRKGVLPRPIHKFSHFASIINLFYLLYYAPTCISKLIIEGLASAAIEDVIMGGSDQQIL